MKSHPETAVRDRRLLVFSCFKTAEILVGGGVWHMGYCRSLGTFGSALVLNELTIFFRTYSGIKYALSSSPTFGTMNPANPDAMRSPAAATRDQCTSRPAFTIHEATR